MHGCRRVGRFVSVSGLLLLFALTALLSGPPVAAINISVPTIAYVGTIGDSTTPVTDCLTPGNTDCTLRDAIAAVAGGSPATVQFGTGFPTGPQTITLTLGTLTLANSVTITGPTGQAVAVDGGCTFSNGACTSGGVTVFTVNSGVTAAISNLTIQHGNAGSGNNGGGIVNLGVLTITNSIFSGNVGDIGGGIYIQNKLTVTNSAFSD
ncbi:MAG: hypothetical protein M3008_11820, partial [Chloroflexota bacterium]|nr:hypothetical protein [Chloroflexota bacterium]